MDNMNNMQDGSFSNEQTVTYDNNQAAAFTDQSTSFGTDQSAPYTDQSASFGGNEAYANNQSNAYSYNQNAYAYQNQGYTYNSYTDTNSYNYVNDNSGYNETKSGLSIAGFVIACISLIFDPLVILSIIGFIFGVIGVSKSTNKTYRGLGIAAWIICIVTFVFQIFVDTIITICTMGFGIFVIFF